MPRPAARLKPAFPALHKQIFARKPFGDIPAAFAKDGTMGIFNQTHAIGTLRANARAL